jgi:hypothetical protein
LKPQKVKTETTESNNRMNIIEGVVAEVMTGQIGIDSHDRVNDNVHQETEPKVNDHRPQ